MSTTNLFPALQHIAAEGVFHRGGRRSVTTVESEIGSMTKKVESGLDAENWTLRRNDGHLPTLKFWAEATARKRRIAWVVMRKAPNAKSRDTRNTTAASALEKILALRGPVARQRQQLKSSKLLPACIIATPHAHSTNLKTQELHPSGYAMPCRLSILALHLPCRLLVNPTPRLLNLPFVQVVLQRTRSPQRSS